MNEDFEWIIPDTHPQTVDPASFEPTGVLDRAGNMIYRKPNPIGFTADIPME